MSFHTSVLHRPKDANTHMWDVQRYFILEEYKQVFAEHLELCYAVLMRAVLLEKF